MILYTIDNEDYRPRNSGCILVKQDLICIEDSSRSASILTPDLKFVSFLSKYGGIATTLLEDIEQQKRVVFYFESIGIKIKKKGMWLYLEKKKAPNGAL